MLRGLWRLTWLEIKIFVREPLGLIGTVLMPVVLFVALGRLGGRPPRTAGTPAPAALASDLPVIVAMLVAVSAVLSLVAIMAIYREGGILKRLRATPLRPHTILTAHVLVKLLFSALTLVVLALAGRRLVPAGVAAPWLPFGAAALFSTACILTLGFVIASVVPTARFAQPLGAVLLYPMLGLSGLFVPVEMLPAGVQTVARLLPLTYAVSLQRGIWRGESWGSHLGDVAVLSAVAVVCVAVSSRVFRWE
jgi:ABC-2 type transport system permease protein